MPSDGMTTAREIAGKRVDWFEPVDTLPRFVLLHLHDVDGVTPAIESLRDGKAACVCPQAGNSWWSAKTSPDLDPAMSAEEFVVRHVVPAIADRWPGVPIVVAGHGMGGQGALRLGFKYPDLFPSVFATDAAIDHYELWGEGTSLDEMYASREHCRQDGAGLHIHPVRQPKRIRFACAPTSRWHRGNGRLHEKLQALGVRHEFVEEALSVLSMCADHGAEDVKRLPLV